MSSDQTKLHPLSATIPSGLLGEIVQFADDNELTISAATRRLLSEAIAARTGKADLHRVKRRRSTGE